MRKQLVVQLARFGDIIQTKRLILSLQQTGSVQLCVDRSLQDLARIIYPDLPIFALPGFGCNPAELLPETLRVLAAILAEDFDEVYILNHAGLSRSLAAMFDSAQVRGYITHKGQSLKSSWVRMAFRWMQRRQASPLNLVDYWAGLAPSLYPPEQVNPSAAPGGKGLGVVLSGQHARRSIEPATLAPIVHAAFERLGGPPVYLLGSEKELDAGRSLLNQLPPKVTQKTKNMAGKTNWAGLADLVEGLDLLLSPDTGTMHLAAHLGTPVEAFFLSSAWAFETGPYGKGHKVWQACQSCSPCAEAVACPFDLRCAQVFKQPEFLRRVLGRLAAKDSSPSGLLVMGSGFDELGLIWNVPNDPWQEQRAAARAVLGEYLGLPPGGEMPELWKVRQAQNIYQEADWFFPPLRP